MSGQGEQLEPVRCPYCVQGYEFRLMTELTGGAGRIFYCPSCRHLVRTAQPDFQCRCRGSMSLRTSTAEKGSSGDLHNRRGDLVRSTSSQR